MQKAKAKDQALKEKLDSLDDELSVLDAQKSQIEGIRAFSLEKINKDALLGTVKVAKPKKLNFVFRPLATNEAE